jgi:hypothetical protein
LHNFTHREMQIIEYLKTHTIKETAQHFEVHRGTVDKLLYNIRNKIEKAHGTVNLATVWKDSKRNPRLAKLLRRQEPRGEETDEEG